MKDKSCVVVKRYILLELYCQKSSFFSELLTWDHGIELDHDIKAADFKRALKVFDTNSHAEYSSQTGGL